MKNKNEVKSMELGKTIKKIALFFVVASLVSCGTTKGIIGNSTSTQVILKENNFKVIESVTGEATCASFFGIGINQRNLYDQARRDMISKAKITGTSRAIINVTVDVRNTWLLMIVQQKTIYVSGEVIEFTE